MSIERYANNASTTLNGSIDNSQGSMVVTSASLFPTSPQFRVLVDSEIMLVTAVAGTTFSVDRGVEGTTATSHADLATVTHVLTSGGLVGVAGSIALSGTYNNLPSSSVEGRLYYSTDSPYILRDTGASWSPWGLVSYLPPPPTSGSLTPLNVTTAALSGSNGTLFINAPNIALAHGQFWFKSLASGSYTWVVRLEPVLLGGTDVQCGLALRDSSGGKIITFEHQISTTFQLRIIQWTDANTRTGSALQLNPIGGAAFPWMKIIDDGTTNREYWVSRDGTNWMKVLTEGRTTWLGVAPNQAGIFATANGADVGLGIYSWSGV